MSTPVGWVSQSAKDAEEAFDNLLKLKQMTPKDKHPFMIGWLDQACAGHEAQL